MNHTVCLPAHRIGKQLSIPANTVPNFIDRVSRSVAKKIMRDPRNYAYLPWGVIQCVSHVFCLVTTRLGISGTVEQDLAPPQECIGLSHFMFSLSSGLASSSLLQLGRVDLSSLSQCKRPA